MTKRTHARTRFDAPPRHPREAAEERIVAQLAERMRAKLALRRHHGDWSKRKPGPLLALLALEVQELDDALTVLRAAPGESNRESAIAEAVDVAAYCAMMIDVLRMEAQ